MYLLLTAKLKWINNLNIKINVDVTKSCDISKAFDRVWHRGLLFKLESIGVSDSLSLWFKSYLADREQRVVLPGTVSAWKYIKTRCAPAKD